MEYNILARDPAMYRALLAVPAFARSLTPGKRADYMIDFGHSVSIRPNYTEYTRHGVKHRADGPALENDRGWCYWYYDGLLHRVDGPAIYCLRDATTQHWYQRGRLHRTDGPAIVTQYEIAWYYDGELHRDDGPAEICLDMSAKWYRHGRLHRDDGPALIYMCGNEYYFLDGIEVPKI